MPRTSSKFIIDPAAVGTVDVHLVRRDGRDVDAYLKPDGERPVSWPYRVGKATTFHLRDHLRGHGYTASVKVGEMEVATDAGEVLYVEDASGTLSIAPRLDPARSLRALMQVADDA